MLQSESGDWILSADGKENEIATTLASKYALAEGATNEYSEVKFTPARQNQLPLPAADLAEKELRSLDPNSGTGPDTLPTRILK